MKNKKDKIEEPFTPDNTPTPPQIIDPNNREENPGNQPVEARKAQSTEGRKNEKPAAPEKKEKQLGDETEITDETTI